MAESYYPALVWSEKKLIHNARKLVQLARETGALEVTGITKSTLGDPKVAAAMLKGGCTSIGDSRLHNLYRLIEADIKCEKILIRSPGLSECNLAVQVADITFNSELEVIRALSESNLHINPGHPHGIVLMVEMGDLREGLMPNDVVNCVREIMPLRGVELVGLGATYGCLSGVVIDQEKIDSFSLLVDQVEEEFNIKLRMISGGTSSVVPRLMERKSASSTNLPPVLGRSTHVRLGESILLGRETVKGDLIPGLFGNVFTIQAEVIESQLKPSIPFGEVCGHNALGEMVSSTSMNSLDDFTNGDCDTMQRALLALGEQDVDVHGLDPVDDGVNVISSSSDHAVLEIVNDNDSDDSDDNNVQVGSVVRFIPNYSALLRAFTSPFMNKVCRGVNERARRTPPVPFEKHILPIVNGEALLYPRTRHIRAQSSDT